MKLVNVGVQYPERFYFPELFLRFSWFVTRHVVYDLENRLPLVT